MSTVNSKDIQGNVYSVPTFTQGLNVNGTPIDSQVNLTEYYTGAGTPSAPANGAVWYNGSITQQYVNSAWQTLTLTLAPVWYGSRGVYSGKGASNAINYITIASPGNAADFGDLTVARGDVAALSNGSRGVFAGGTGLSNVIDYITVGSTGNATDFGDMLAAADQVSGCSNGPRGVIAGGFTATNTPQDVLQYITIATTGNATDFGNLLSAIAGTGALSDGVKGVFGGGGTAGNPPSGFSNVVQYVAIATTGNATDFGDLTVARSEVAGASSLSRGVFAGGYTGSTSNVMDYITIATTSNATVQRATLQTLVI